MTTDLDLDGGVRRVRLDWFVAAELATLFGLLFFAIALADGDGPAAVPIAIVGGVGCAALDRWPACFVAHGDGLVVPTWWHNPWWRRREVRWDQVLGVELLWRQVPPRGAALPPT